MPGLVEGPPVQPGESEQFMQPKPVVGIIYPPPEVRNIVDKTASFVARNGPEFETRIRQNEINNPKFNFLNPGDPYHAYYQHKVVDFKEGKALEIASGLDKIPAPSLQQKQQDLLRQVELQPIELRDPPPEFEFIADPPSISAYDLDVVKLTAQFVARNGRQFLSNLMNREQRNYQFDFLRPQHSLFQYFTKLVEQYIKVLIPPKDVMKKLKDEALDPAVILNQVRYRVEWQKQQEAAKRKVEEEIQRDREAYAQIDWHDFVVVETIDFQQNESGHFPPPTTPEDVGKRVLVQDRLEDGEEMDVESEGEPEPVISKDNDDTQLQDMEESSSDEEKETEKVERAPGDKADSDEEKEETKAPVPPKSVIQPPALPPKPGQVLVRKDYNPKEKVKTVKAAPKTEQYLISPITGEKIPASKVQEHMRIGLLDPRWVEQRDKTMTEKVAQDSAYAQGASIESSLKQFAERRTDIFGFGDEETVIGKKIGEEDKKIDDKVVWDGHTASIEGVTRAAKANISLEEQIQQIHKAKGLLPDEEKEKIGPKPKDKQQPPPPPPGPPPKAKQPPPPPPPGPPPKAQPPPPPQQPPPPQKQPPPPPPHPMGGPPPPGPPMMGPPGMMGPPNPQMMMHPLAMRPPMMPPMPPRGYGPPMGPPMGGYPPPAPHEIREMEEEPPTKKLRTEDSLMPEGDFLQRFGAQTQVVFKVHVPLVDKSEWNLKGQMLTLSLPLTDTVSVIKAKIHNQTGMPPGKQKLSCEGLFFKDSNTLGFYNITPGTGIQLHLKERGGRKK